MGPEELDKLRQNMVSAFVDDREGGALGALELIIPENCQKCDPADFGE